MGEDKKNKQGDTNGKINNKPALINLPILLGALGLGATLIAALRTFLVVESSVTSTGSTAVSYLSTWNCKRAHEILSQLTFHRLRDIGAGKDTHTASTDDLALGVVNLRNYSIQDYHSLRGSTTSASTTIQSVLLGHTASATADMPGANYPANNHMSADRHIQKTTADSLPTGIHAPTNLSAHNHTPDNHSSSSHHNSLSTEEQPQGLLQKASCEQLQHGVSPEQTDVYLLSRNQAIAFARDYQQRDTWALFLYGPWHKDGSEKMAFAIAKINPSYLEIAHRSTSLKEIMPPGSGGISAETSFINNDILTSADSLRETFPALADKHENLKSVKLLPFRNQTIALESGANKDSIFHLSLRTSGATVAGGSILSLSIYLLSRSAYNQQKLLHGALERESRLDPLTRIPNRRQWDEALERAENDRKNNNKPWSIIAIDLNDFKQVNDLAGHHAGDTLLKQVAEVLSEKTQTSDLVSRLGGDEFAILSQTNSEDDCLKLINAISKELSGRKIKASFGYALTDSITSLQKAWNDADHSMYSHKRKSKQQGESSPVQSQSDRSI